MTRFTAVAVAVASCVACSPSSPASERGVRDTRVAANEPPPSPVHGPGSVASRAGSASSAVVVELFTSQGCNSCPPADRLLTELPGTHADVIPLAFHVDYWNGLGWKDPFSSPQWSARQRAYARVLSRGNYTPQLVVQGADHAVGSQRGEVLGKIDEARKSVPVAVTACASRKGGGIAVQARLDAPDPTLELWAVLTEDGIRTEVTRGENTGKTLLNDHIVRELVPVDAGVATLSLSRAQEPANTHVTVIAQSAETLRIRAGQRVHLAASCGI